MGSKNVADDVSDDEFDLEENSIPNSETVTQRLKEFTYYLVENIEYNLNFCLQLLEERVVPSKPTSLHVTALSLLFSAIPKIGGGVSSTLKTGESTIFRKIEKKNSRILADLVYYFSDNKETFRNTVIEAATEIFSSFENQFIKLTCNGGEKRAMQKLAIDASDRIFNYFLITEQSKNVTKKELMKGILLGDSKRNKKGKKEGKSVVKDKTKWKTCKLYAKTGVFISQRNVFYKNNDSKPQKYGYRKIFSWENEADIMKTWILDNHFEIPTYSLNLTEDLVKDIKEYVMTKTPHDEDKLERMKYSKEAMGDRQHKHTETLKILKEYFNNILDEMNQLFLKVTSNTESNTVLLESVAKNQEEETKKQSEIITKLELVHVDVIETKEKQEDLVRTSENIQNDIVEIKHNQDEMSAVCVKSEDFEEIVRNQAKESAREGIKEFANETLQRINLAPIIRNGVEITVPKIKEVTDKAVPKIVEINNDVVEKIAKQVAETAPKVKETLDKTLQQGGEEIKKVEEKLKELFKF